MLFQSENQFFKQVLVELIIFRPQSLMVSHRTVNAENAGLIDFLGLYDRCDPVLLPLLELSTRILRQQQLLLILAEVLGADILNLVQFLVVFHLEGFAMRCRSVRLLQHDLAIFIALRTQSPVDFISDSGQLSRPQSPIVFFLLLDGGYVFGTCILKIAKLFRDIGAELGYALIDVGVGKF